MTDNLIEVEIDIDRNRNLYFVPLERSLRGRFDWKRVADKHGPELRSRWGEEPLPGQTISLDLENGEGAILEPLYGRSEIRKEIESRGESLAPESQTYSEIDPLEWLYWIRLAVQSGKARILRGTLPATVDYRPKRFGQIKSTTERLAEALLAVLYSGMTEKQKKEVTSLIGT